MDVFSLLLVALALGVGFLIVRANLGKGRRLSGPGADLSLPGRGGEPIEQVGPGGVFNLRAVGPNMEDLDVTVLARHVYDENGFKWVELECDSGTATVWVTVERDDGLDVSITLRKLHLDDIGLTKAKLKRFDDEERGSFTFEGKEYVYEDSDEAVFHRNGDRSTRESFYYWEFAARDGSDSITVEQWRDGSFEVHLSQPVRPSQITVYSASGGA